MPYKILRNFIKLDLRLFKAGATFSAFLAKRFICDFSSAGLIWMTLSGFYTQ